MKIVLITPGFSASEKDWCIPAQLNLVRRLARHHEVHVYALRYPDAQRQYRVYDATVHAYGGTLDGGIRRVPLLTSVLQTIVQEHRRHNFDILHGLWADEPGFLAVTAGRLLGRPAVVSLLGGELARFPDIRYGHQLSLAARCFIHCALRGAEKVTVGSTFLRKVVGCRVPAHRLEVLPLGVDRELFREGAAPVPLRGRRKVLHVASLVPVKEQTMLLQAFSQVARMIEGAHLHIVGSGTLRARLEALAAKWVGKSLITFHGHVPHHELPNYYAASDLCVLSSRYESQGMVTLEAAACGRATVGTAVGILPDLMPAHAVVPAENLDMLTQALVRAAEAPEQYRELGDEAKEQVASRYTLPRMVARLEEMYQELL